jgi:hypothetical protein
LPPAEIGTAQQENPVSYTTDAVIDELNRECSVYLDELDGTYVVDVFGYPMPILLDQHEVSWYANAEDPAFDEIEMNS